MRRLRGSNAIEFVLILPLLLMFVMAILDWGLYFQMRRGVVDAVRDGIRAAVAHPDRTEIEQVAKDRIELLLAGQGLCDRSPCTVTLLTQGAEGQRTLTGEAAASYDAPIGLVETPDEFRVSFTMMLEMQ